MPLFPCRRVCAALLFCARALAAFFLWQRLLPADPEKTGESALRVGLEDHYPLSACGF